MAKMYQGEGYMLSVTTLQEEIAGVVKEKQEDALMGILKTGGCFSICMTEESIAEMKRLQVNGNMNTVRPGFYVILVEDFVANLSKTEVDAIVYHELGHIAHDHLSKLTAGKVEKADNIINDVSLELEADAFRFEVR